MMYRCPVDPAGCGDTERPGFCATHRGIRLERVRSPFAAATVVSADAGPPAGGAVQDAPAPSSSGPSSGPSSDPGEVRLLAVRVLGRVMPVPPGGLVLGREAPATRYLPGFADLRHVGRRHAHLYWQRGSLYLLDLGSQNKTFVDGLAISEPVPLLPGQVFNLAGDTDVVVVEIDENGFEVTRP